MDERSILPDLNRISIGDEIKETAERIFKQLDTTTKRGNKRKKLIFYCVYNAYKSLGIIEDAKTIADIVGIAPADITKAFSLYSEVRTSYQAPVSFHTPNDFIHKYYKEVGLSPECLEPLLNLADEVLALDPELYESYPQVVATGIILYYMTINGVAVNKKELAKLIGKSEMTIVKMYKRVSDAHNQ